MGAGPASRGPMSACAARTRRAWQRARPHRLRRAPQATAHREGLRSQYRGESAHTSRSIASAPMCQPAAAARKQKRARGLVPQSNRTGAGRATSCGVARGPPCRAASRWRAVWSPPGAPTGSSAGSPSPSAPLEYAPHVSSSPASVSAPYVGSSMSTRRTMRRDTRTLW
jgi:hypothetical protein